MMGKECLKCHKLKLTKEFPKSQDSKDGLNTWCKICVNIKNKIYRESNKEKFKLARQKHYQRNIVKMRLEKIKYGKNHKKEKAFYDIEYRQKNKEKIKQYKKIWERKRRSNPIFKIKVNLRRRIAHVLKGENKSAKSFELIGCSPEQFKIHIEKQFQCGMTWDNYGLKGWHIDHIIPCYKFDLTKPEEQRKCFHYSNQRPLWAKDNLSRPKN